MYSVKPEQPAWTRTANGANKRLLLHVRLRSGSLSITTPVSLLANEYDVWSIIARTSELGSCQLYLCCWWRYERLQYKGLLKGLLQKCKYLSVTSVNIVVLRDVIYNTYCCQRIATDLKFYIKSLFYYFKKKSFYTFKKNTNKSTQNITVSFASVTRQHFSPIICC